MINDDKRHEVAEKLRKLEIVEFDESDFFDCSEVDEALGLVIDDGAWYEAKGVWNLAMLIDRPTTSIGVNKHGRAYCTNCGCNDLSLSDGNARYCLLCGKRIRYDE